MKKNTFKRACAALSVAAVAASATSMFAFAYDSSSYVAQFGEEIVDQAATSEVKPTIAWDKIELTETEAQEKAAAGTPVDANVIVSGANLQYASIGLHFIYDTRLTAVADQFGNIVKKGPALEQLGFTSKDIEPGVAFAASDCSGNFGIDGTAYTMSFLLPEDVKAGDVFELSFDYRSTSSAEDVFTNLKNDDAGKLMQHWIFTQGLQDGYIKVLEPETTTTTTVVSTTEGAESTTTAAGSTTTTAAGGTGTGSGSAPQTGVAGVGVAAAGLAVAVGAAFALRKKED